MAGNFSMNNGFNLTNGASQFNSSPRAFNVTQTNVGGPTPGTVTVAASPGTTISLSALTTPGIVQIVNLEPSGGNFITFGLWEATGSIFRPFGEVWPGETFNWRFSRSILTANTAADVFRIVADTAACKVLVAAFEK